MQRGMNAPSRQAMDPRKFPHSDTPVALHLGGDNGDECRVSIPPLGVETPLDRRQFPLLYLLHDVVNLCPLQGHVAIQLFDSFFDLLETFPGDSESAIEITDRCHCEKWRA